MAITLGLDVGGTKVLGVAVDAGGTVRAERRVSTPVGLDGLRRALVEAAEALRADTAGDETRAVGVGLPGLVDRQGVLRTGPHLPEARMWPAAAELGHALGLPVRVDNDANVATWGEARAGAGRGVGHVVMVTVGTGLGGGIVVDGTLVRGANGFAGEIGHLPVVSGGRVCPCGQAGCWERYASGTALGMLAREAAAAGRAPAVLARAGGSTAEVSGEHVTDAAAEGDRAAIALLAELGHWLAVGLAGLVDVFDPERIVVGGGLADAGDLLLGPTRAALDRMVMGHDVRPSVPVVPAALGERAGAIGAALLAREPVESARG